MTTKFHDIDKPNTARRGTRTLEALNGTDSIIIVINKSARPLDMDSYFNMSYDEARWLAHAILNKVGYTK